LIHCFLRHVHNFRSGCFSGCCSRSSVSFEMDSELARIKSNDFYSLSLTSIGIPCNVQVLCLSCFSSCGSLSPISFITNSELACVESKSFIGVTGWYE
jgi:hypothetical protein